MGIPNWYRTFVDLQYHPRRDNLQLDFKLSSGALNENFVFAVVAKDELLSVRDGRCIGTM